MGSHLLGIIDLWGITLHTSLSAEEMKLMWQLTGKKNKKNYTGWHAPEYLNGSVDIVS